MRREIEVKARVDDLEGLTQKLEALGIVLSEPIVQNDETFVDADYGDYGVFQGGKNLLRIREENGKFIFNIKQPQSNEQDALERESEITDPVEFREALLLMGYQPVVQIHKTRRKGTYKGYEICLDEVQELGTFVEIEKITDDQDAKVVQDELFEFLESLGIQRGDRVTKGYDTMVYLKKPESG